MTCNWFIDLPTSSKLLSHLNNHYNCYRLKMLTGVLDNCVSTKCTPGYFSSFFVHLGYISVSVYTYFRLDAIFVFLYLSVPNKDIIYEEDFLLIKKLTIACILLMINKKKTQLISNLNIVGHISWMKTRTVCECPGMPVTGTDLTRLYPSPKWI